MISWGRGWDSVLIQQKGTGSPKGLDKDSQDQEHSQGPYRAHSRSVSEHKCQVFYCFLNFLFSSFFLLCDMILFPYFSDPSWVLKYRVDRNMFTYARVYDLTIQNPSQTAISMLLKRIQDPCDCGIKTDLF